MNALDYKFLDVPSENHTLTKSSVNNLTRFIKSKTVILWTYHLYSWCVCSVVGVHCFFVYEERYKCVP